MGNELGRAALQRVRLTAQGVTQPVQRDIMATVARLGSVQAQEKRWTLQTLRPRCPAVTQAEVEQALHTERRIVRTWCLRGTLHLVTAADLRWLLALVAPRLLRNSERRYRQLELDARTLESSTTLLADMLHAQGPLTRPELAQVLEAHGISSEGQRLPHMLRRAALAGAICLAPDRPDGSETYANLADWLPADLSQSSGDWSTLARRYLEAYGPASVEDFATWSGARIPQARAAFEALQPVPVAAEGETLWVLPGGESRLTEAPVRAVHLIPAYDPLLLGYRRRDWLVHPDFAREIHPGGGLLRPTVLVGGEAAGTWGMTWQGRSTRVTVSLFHAVNEAQRAQLQAEVDDLGRFLGKPARLQVA